MTVVRERRPARRARELLVAAWGAALLLLALSLPVLAAPPGPTKLLSPDVTPRQADAATPVAFTITYRNAHALPPEYVRVAVGGRTYPMTGDGTDWKAGVVFTVTTTLPAGTHDVRFEARDAERFVDELAAGSVSIGAAPPPPPPPPTPEPTDPPGSTPDPGTSGGGGSGGTGGSGTGTGGTSGTNSGTTGGPGSGSTGSSGTIDADGWDDLRGTGRGAEGMGVVDAPTAWDSIGGSGGTASGVSSSEDAIHQLPWFIAGLGGTGSGGAGSADGGAGGGNIAGGGAGAGSGLGDTGGSAPGDDPKGAANGDGIAGAQDGSAGAGDPAAWLQSSFDAGLAALGLGGSGELATIPAVVGSTVMVTTWMAFMLFNKRRRDGEPPAPDGVLQAAAAAGIGMGLVFAPAPVAPPDPESLMPRWRRPSLLEARKTDPVRSPAPERPRLTFSIGETAVVAGAERRTIRYAVIPLLDRPDEIQATRIGELVAGDEVQIEQRSGAYCHVLCPDGRQGWVHRTTLGDLVETPEHGNGRAPEPEPEAENALAAMLAARGLR
ncbi:MAG: SH3 domain-containing protein [Chloroflexota bacterium]|nr:MAG: SH3 domain-containing protein [Chloroflexota bacterium]